MLDQDNHCVLIDLGFATSLAGDAKGFLHDAVGTEMYAAPEILAKKPYKGTQVDLFSLGAIFYMLVTGAPAFEGAKETDHWYRPISNGRMDTFWKEKTKQLSKKYGEEF